MMTILMLCFNELDHTKKAIKSILDNSPLNKINFLFIDNGSTDGTYEFLKKVPSSHIIRNEKNLYVNPAWNQGFKYFLENNLGEYLCLINNDVFVGKKWLDSIFELFSTHISHFYLPMSNTQDNPPFHHPDEFLRFAKESWEKPLYLVPENKNFVGFCMFFKKEHVPLFYPVPEQMKVLCGDDWITDVLAHNRILPVRVSRCAIHHFSGATQRGMPIHDIRTQDTNEFNKLYKTVYKERGMGRIFENKKPEPKLL